MKKKIISYSILILLVLVGASYLILQYSYSDGQRVGKLVKLSRKGFLPKTYEGTLDLGSGDQLTWNFSVHNRKLGDELAKQTGKFVVLEYRELLWRLFYQTKYDVIGWKIEKKDSAGKEELCRLVNILRKDKSLVERIRPMIVRYDAPLLELVRECQR